MANFYDYRIYYKCKQLMLAQLINIKIKLNRDYDTLSLEFKYKYHKKYNDQYYFKPEIKKLLKISDKKVKKSCIDKIMNKQNKLLLNRICSPCNDDNYLKKCICNSYCPNPLKKFRYRQDNIVTYYSYNNKNNHNSRLSKIIQNEKYCERFFFKK